MAELICNAGEWFEKNKDHEQFYRATYPNKIIIFPPSESFLREYYFDTLKKLDLPASETLSYCYEFLIAFYLAEFDDNNIDKSYRKNLIEQLEESFKDAVDTIVITPLKTVFYIVAGLLIVKLITFLK